MTGSDRAFQFARAWWPALVLLGFLTADLRIDPLSWSPAQLGPASHRILLSLVWGLGAVAVLALRSSRANITRSTRLIAAGLALGLVTSVFSDNPGRSASIGIGFVIVTVATALLAGRLGHDTTIRVLIGGLIAICAASLLLGLFEISASWELSTPRRLTGILAEPNSLGQLGGLLAVLSGAMWFEHKLRPTVGAGAVVLGVLVAALSLTRTIGLALVVAAFVAGFVRRPKPTLLLSAALSVVGAAVLFAVGTDPITDLIDRGQGVEEIATLSNRLNLWEVSIDEIESRPLTGHGFGSGPRRFELALDQGRLPWIYSPSSHNLGLEIAREIGLPAFVLIAMGAAMGASRVGTTRPAMFAYLGFSALLMPTTGVPGTLLVAWVVVTAGDKEHDSG